MKKYTAEDIVMNSVCNGGDCRSKALEAIQAARKGNFEQADALMAQAQQSMGASGTQFPDRADPGRDAGGRVGKGGAEPLDGSRAGSPDGRHGRVRPGQ